MSIQDLGRDVPNPPNHAAAVKHTKDEGGTYGEALQRTDMQEKLKQYENLQGQGWFHPDIVNELRSQLDLWKRQCAFESEHREKYRNQIQPLVDALDLYHRASIAAEGTKEQADLGRRAYLAKRAALAKLKEQP